MTSGFTGSVRIEIKRLPRQIFEIDFLFVPVDYHKERGQLLIATRVNAERSNTKTSSNLGQRLLYFKFVVEILLVMSDDKSDCLVYYSDFDDYARSTRYMGKRHTNKKLTLNWRANYFDFGLTTQP